MEKRSFNRTLGFLMATVSKVDFKAIKSLDDHKGDLTVIFNKDLLNLFDQVMKTKDNESAYTSFLQQKIRHAWEAEGEFNVEFKTD